MVPLRLVFLVVAVAAAACAAKPSQDSSVAGIRKGQLELNALVHEQVLEIHGTRLTSVKGAASNAVKKALKKLNELLQKVYKKLGDVETKVVNAAKRLSENAVQSLNDAIEKVTGADWGLEQKWEQFETKIAACSAKTQTELKDIFSNMKKEAETCAEKPLEDAKQISAEVLAIADTVESVIDDTKKTINACNEAAEKPAARKRRSIWSKTKCIAKGLENAVEEVGTVVKGVAKITTAAVDLISPATKATLEACAVKVASGEAVPLQQATADLATCILAPAASA